MTRDSNSVAETEAIAAELAKNLRSGECIALIGELGAGKTQFVRGMVAGLGGDPHRVSSPTFVLLNIYETPKLRVFHLDAYRLSGAEDFDAIGFTELLEQGGVVIVEWADRVAALLPPKHLVIRITHMGPDQRRIEAEAAASAS